MQKGKEIEELKEKFKDLPTTEKSKDIEITSYKLVKLR